METIRQSYLNTIDELNRELLALKEQFALNHQQPDVQTIDSPSESSSSDELNHIYEQLRHVLPISNEATLDDIISHINNLIKENNLFKQKEIDQQLLFEKPGLLI